LSGRCRATISLADQGCSASAARPNPRSAIHLADRAPWPRGADAAATRTRSTCQAEVPHRDCLSETESGLTRLCHRGGHWPRSGRRRL